MDGCCYSCCCYSCCCCSSWLVIFTSFLLVYLGSRCLLSLPSHSSCLLLLLDLIFRLPAPTPLSFHLSFPPFLLHLHLKNPPHPPSRTAHLVFAFTCKDISPVRHAHVPLLSVICVPLRHASSSSNTPPPPFYCLLSITACLIRSLPSFLPSLPPSLSPSPMPCRCNGLHHFPTLHR